MNNSSKKFGLSGGNKAIIVIKRKNGTQDTVHCDFNPTDYSLTQKVGWEVKSVKGKDQPQLTFKGGDQTTLSLKLLFDTSFEGTDVRMHTRLLWDATRIDQTHKNPKTDKGEPAHIIFMWGSTWSFEAIVTNLTQDFTFFSEDGTPLRSNVTLSLTQIKDDSAYAKQNPTSGGTPTNIHIVRAGDRLDLLAAQHYNQAMAWRQIAEYNKLDDPADLRPGQRLIIPSLSS